MFQELSQTKQFKAEVAQQLEEKRRANEPLNKAALEKMIKVYNAENLRQEFLFFPCANMFARNDPSLRDKVLKNPELSLIGLDPKAILAKHQNDFSQVCGHTLLRTTDSNALLVFAAVDRYRRTSRCQGISP